MCRSDRAGARVCHGGERRVGLDAQRGDGAGEDRTGDHGTVAVGRYAVWGVGLYAVEARATGVGCDLHAFVRVTGRHPLTTAAGLTGLGLLAVGAAGARHAAGRRRRGGAIRGRSLAAGALGGLGAAVLLQQFAVVPMTSGLLLGAPAAGGVVTLAAVWAVRGAADADRSNEGSSPPLADEEPRS